MTPGKAEAGSGNFRTVRYAGGKDSMICDLMATFGLLFGIGLGWVFHELWEREKDERWELKQKGGGR